MTRIGGHENYDVQRWPLSEVLSLEGEAAPDDVTVVTHTAQDAYQMDGLMREVGALEAMSGTGFAPEYLGLDWPDNPRPPMTVIETDLGDTETTYTDGEALRHSMVWLLATIRAAGLRHGDLTNRNLIIRDNAMKAID